MHKKIDSIKLRRILAYSIAGRNSPYFGYRKIIDKQNYAVYDGRFSLKIILAAYQDMVVCSNRKKTKITIYPDYHVRSIKYTVRFNNKTFDGLLENSRLEYCRIIPYVRRIAIGRSELALRLMVVTDRGQIYHNYPSRSEELELEGEPHFSDIKRFKESVIWDLPGRKYPSKRKENDAYEKFYLGLPDICYEYHPPIKKNDTDEFGGVNFPAHKIMNGKILSRFYIARRESQGNPFCYMAGFCCDAKMALLGTYRSNIAVGVRSCIFASDDGGRQWYCKYEFGDLGEYPFQLKSGKWGRNFGNKISLLRANGEQKNTLYISKRVLNLTDGKEPAANWESKIEISKILQSDTMIIETSTPHKLRTGNIIRIERNASNDDAGVLEWAVWDCKNDNACLFKVEVCSEREFKIYECVADVANPICCRHIHHISRVRDGWIIGTGETYPNGWLFYIQMKESDTFSKKSAADEFFTVRLNSTNDSVQRTMGVIWKDDECNTIIYASDHDDFSDEYSHAKLVMGDAGVHVSRNATGVYIGKLSDIDDRSKFVPVYEAKEEAYFFDKVDGALVFCGQRGELALSFDGGKNWDVSQIPGALTCFHGNTFDYQVFDNYLLEIKR